MSRYFGEFGQQVQAGTRTVSKVLVAAVSVALVLLVLVVAVGAASATHIVKPDQATALALFSGKAATAADTAIIAQVTRCGAQTGTIIRVQWSGPPLRVSGDTLGSNASLSAPGPDGQSEAACLAAQNLAKGATAQSCPAIALGAGGSATADARSFTESYVSCMSAVGAS